MSDEATRRTVLAAGAGGVGLLAGCVSGTEGEAESENDGSDEPTSVTMEPVGTVEFDSPPETWLTYEIDYADMGIALGVGEGLEAIGEENRYLTQYYDELGIPYAEDPQALWNGGVDKEVFYDLDVDVHLVDPNWLEHNSAFGLDGEDVDELEENVAPFVGNTIFRQTDEWHDYEYYTMYEAFEKVAQVFGREDRYEAFAELHESFLEEIESSLPPADERPEGVLVWAEDEPESFTAMRISDGGTANKHFRDLGIEDAFEGTDVAGRSTDNSGEIDFETLADVDPDAIFLSERETESREEFESGLVDYLRDHPVGGDLTAVQEGRVYRGGPIYQGPIYNLFLTERVARAVYPDQFDGDLFDRDEVSAIVEGDL
ncbi:ABC transporter substrate-binding protein [Natrialbaceae archaeon GCM10025810]|uniref:ABC transporter substrate-binding protein n=1 Tax=Halovalidus salilacus TaxID=3075124 RepID=UPI00361E06F5